ncbi:MAG TPA: phosphatase PAP2 family protein [Polyangiaceae bacterium]|nr:phosphatase PAP2 family protein [Polyangiaceae bacterium]
MRALDKALFFLLYGPSPPPAWLTFMAAWSLVGGGYALLAIAPWVLVARVRRAVVGLLAAILLTALVVFAMKHGFGRVRPYAALEGVRALAFAPPTDPSFPSGHAAGSACLAAYFADRARPARTALLALAAGLVALSRIVLGVHFPLDTLVGALVGGTIGALMARRAMPKTEQR